MPSKEGCALAGILQIQKNITQEIFYTSLEKYTLLAIVLWEHWIKKTLKEN